MKLNFMKTKNTILTTLTAATWVALAGCGGSPSDSSSSAPAKPSAVPNSFAEVSAKLDPNGSLYLYYSTEDVIETVEKYTDALTCLLYTSPSPRDGLLSRIPASA